MAKLKIGLPEWIIQDGNYPDFAVGEDRKFALECTFNNDDGIVISASGIPKLVPQSEANYLTAGK